MSWKPPCRPSGNSCHKNTSTRWWRTSSSARLPARLWLPTVVTSSICSKDLQVCILISSPTKQFFSESPTDYRWRQRSERWERGLVLGEIVEFCHFPIYFNQTRWWNVYLIVQQLCKISCKNLHASLKYQQKSQGVTFCVHPVGLANWQTDWQTVQFKF